MINIKTNNLMNILSVKKIKQRLAFIVLVVAIQFWNADIRATVYYVDAINGDDKLDGKTITTAWQSLNKINNTGFHAGDSVLFKCGCVWNGALNITSSGTIENPITFSSYGTGNKPLINGGGNVRDALYIENPASNIIVSGFAVTNFAGPTIFDGSETLRCGIRIGEWRIFLS
jgi:hypothetical protein